MAEKTFYKITNKDIYEKLEDIEKHVERTNGKVNVNRWVSTTALSLTVIILVFLIQHSLK